MDNSYSMTFEMITLFKIQGKSLEIKLLELGQNLAPFLFRDQTYRWLR